MSPGAVVFLDCPHHNGGEVGFLYVSEQDVALYGSPEKLVGPGYAHETFSCSRPGCKYAPEVGPDGRARVARWGRLLAAHGIMRVDLDRLLRVDPSD